MGLAAFSGGLLALAFGAPATWQCERLSSTRGELPAPDLGRQVAALAGDLDGDGRLDFVIASYERMAWFQNTPLGWHRRLIEAGDPAVRLEAGGLLHDVDGDGRLDVVMGAQSKAGEVWWWRNPGPDHPADQPWPRHLALAVGGTHHDQAIGDFDGDGRPELAFWYNAGRQLYLADLPPDPRQPWPYRLVAQLDAPGPPPEGLVAGDLNGDGTVELVGGGYWFEHRAGEFVPHPIDPAYGFSRTAVGQLWPDPWQQVVINSGDAVGPLRVYHYDGRQWQAQTVIERVDHGHTLQLADFDGDGNLDIYVAEMHTPGPGEACRQWICWGDGRGGFLPEVIAVGQASHESKVGDFDGDGRPDLLVKDFQQQRRVDLWLNRCHAAR